MEWSHFKSESWLVRIWIYRTTYESVSTSKPWNCPTENECMLILGVSVLRFPSLLPFPILFFFIISCFFVFSFIFHLSVIICFILVPVSFPPSFSISFSSSFCFLFPPSYFFLPFSTFFIVDLTEMRWQQNLFSEMFVYLPRFPCLGNDSTSTTIHWLYYLPLSGLATILTFCFHDENKGKLKVGYIIPGWLSNKSLPSFIMTERDIVAMRWLVVHLRDARCMFGFRQVMI
jgi:hypothetical protein